MITKLKGETMKEYFVEANSFAAPFFSDNSTSFVKGNNPKEAMEKFVKQYTHPCGLYAALLYENSEDYHKNKKALVKWLSNKAQFMCNKSGRIKIICEGKIEIDGKLHIVENPREGKIIINQ